MDRLAYLASSGAKQLLHRQETIAHNLANANTPGFRADLDALRSVPVRGGGLNSRVFAVESTPSFNAQAGPLQATGRELDIAIPGEGWLAVQALDGTEAYTRGGALEVGSDGVLRNHAGLQVVGDGGPINVPENAQIAIAGDGTVSATTNGRTATVVGRLKLVNPPVADLVKAGDGLFRLRDAGGDVPVDPAVKVVSGSIEGSNVNVVEAMVSMIAVARQFETEMRMLNSADQNARDATKLLANNS